MPLAWQAATQLEGWLSRVPATSTPLKPLMTEWVQQGKVADSQECNTEAVLDAAAVCAIELTRGMCVACCEARCYYHYCYYTLFQAERARCIGRQAMHQSKICIEVACRLAEGDPLPASGPPYRQPAAKCTAVSWHLRFLNVQQPTHALQTSNARQGNL